MKMRAYVKLNYRTKSLRDSQKSEEMISSSGFCIRIFERYYLILKSAL